MTNSDLDESVMPIAPDFVSFLDLVGLAPPKEELEWSPTLESRVPSAEAATRVDDDALYEVLDDENAIWTLYGGTRGFGAGKLRVVLQLAHGLVASGQPFLSIVKAGNGATIVDIEQIERLWVRMGLSRPPSK